MQSRTTKFVRRRFRSARRSMTKYGGRSVGHLRSNLLGRSANLRLVRRRIILWVALVAVLIAVAALQIVANRTAYTKVAATPGGTYVEGTVGALETLNPILATTASELSASRLLFSGLFDYDQSGIIRPALATSIDTSDAKTYTIHLRKNVAWSDGKPFTSADVVYTIGLIQNPTLRSPLASSFRNVTVKAVDDSTVTVALPAAYAPFVQSLTFGMLPKHVLGSTDPADIRGSGFNLDPVTLGPFVFTGFRAQDASGNPAVYMSRNDDYYRPLTQVDRFQLHAYQSQDDMIQAYQRREIGALGGVSEANATTAQNNRSSTKVTNVAVDNGEYALFNTKSEPYNDAKLRAAIRQGTDIAAIRRLVGGGVGELNGPVLKSQVPEVSDLTQQSGNIDAAKKSLDDLGWKAGSNGLRSKDNRMLTMRLVAIDTGDYPKVARALANQWRKLGIDVQLALQPSESASEQVLVPRSFDVLIYELAIGADPDVYAYWHSSQTGQGGLNFSGYSSGLSDDLLSSARSTLDARLRNAKYVAFAKQWLSDAPAVALFQQSYHYLSSDDYQTLPATSTLVTQADRFATVNDWTTDVKRVFVSP